MTRTVLASLGLSLFATLSGCISSGVAPLVEAPEPSEADAISEAAASLETGEAWRALLTRDVQDVEGKGEAFLQSSFKLYDLLLSSAPKAALDQQLALGRASYADLVRAARRLSEDLGRPEMQQKLTLEGDEDAADLKRVAELFANVPLDVVPEGAALSYDPEGGTPMADLLLGAAPPSPTADKLPEEGLARTERDALELLDRLRTVSTDLAFVSDTVSAWAQLPADEKPTELMNGPYAMDQDALAPLGR